MLSPARSLAPRIARLGAVSILLAPTFLGGPLFAQPAVSAVAEQVVTVRAFDARRRALGDVSGFATGSGFVVTSAHVLSRAATVIVINPGGARQFPAEIRSFDERSGVAVLEATGLTVAGMVFAMGDAGGTPEAGDVVHIPRFRGDGRLDDQLVRGLISEVRSEDPDVLGQRSFSIYRHNAAVAAREYGMPMLNDCGQVVGMASPDPEESSGRLDDETPDPDRSGFGVAGTEVRLALGTLGADPRVAGATCLDAYVVAAREAEAAREREQQAATAREQVDAAQREAAEAREEAEAARRQAAEARDVADAGRREAATAREEADAARARVTELEARAAASEAEREAARQEAEAARATAEERETAAADLERRADASQATAEQAEARVAQLERTRHLLTMAAVAVGLVLVLVTLTTWRMLSRRRRQLARSEAERKATGARLAAAVTPASFSCLLEGSDQGGRNLVVKVGPEQLGLSGGVVVGRNPASSGVLLDHPEASREHFRLCVRDNGLTIEDLRSTNGTFVNGKAVTVGNPIVLSPGDEIGVGAAISLTLSISG